MVGKVMVGKVMKKQSDDRVGFAVTKYVRMSPKRSRLEASRIRRMKVNEVLGRLMLTCSKSARCIYKTVQSAVSNFEYKFSAKREDLRLWELRIDEGPRIKRSQTTGKGRSSPIIKPTVHITAIVKEI